MAGTSPAELEMAGRGNAIKWKKLMDEQHPEHSKYYCEYGQYHGFDDTWIDNCYMHKGEEKDEGEQKKAVGCRL